MYKTENKKKAVGPNKAFFITLLLCPVLCISSAIMGIIFYNILTNATPWRIQKINISGHDHLSTTNIQNILGVPYGASIWWYRLPDLANRLKAHPWIREAFVRWDFPETLSIHIVERQALAAICCYSNICYYIDNFGVVFNECDKCTAAKYRVYMHSFEEIINTYKGTNFVQELFFSEFYALVHALVSVRWPPDPIVINYDKIKGFSLASTATTIHIGHEDFKKRLKIVKKVMENEKISLEGGKPVEIDARYMRWIYIRSGTPTERGKNGKDS